MFSRLLPLVVLLSACGPGLSASLTVPPRPELLRADTAEAHARAGVAGPSSALVNEAAGPVAMDPNKHARILEPCPYQWLAQIPPQSPRPLGAAWVQATPTPPAQVWFSVEAPAEITQRTRYIAVVTGPPGQFLVSACTEAEMSCTSCAVKLR